MVLLCLGGAQACQMEFTPELQKIGFRATPRRARQHVAVLTQATVDTVAIATASSAALIAACADEDRLMAAIPPPSDPKVATAVEATASSPCGEARLATCLGATTRRPQKPTDITAFYPSQGLRT